MHLACGDSLYHGRQKQMMLDSDWTDESHYFQAEDNERLREILKEGTFHAVMANPPYITPKDKAANDVYRDLYKTCHKSYSLSVPFMERIFRLAAHSGGFTGQITSNSFMKREFGKKLVEEFFPTVDVTHVIDSSGAYIPGHGTPTVILYGRNRKPMASTVRCIACVKGEPGTPADPSVGLNWTALVDATIGIPHVSEYVSATDTPRESFATHPWSMGTPDALNSIEIISSRRMTLSSFVKAVGASIVTRLDDVFLLPTRTLDRKNLSAQFHREATVGEHIRDWVFEDTLHALWPYNSAANAAETDHSVDKWLWPWRRPLRERVAFGKTQIERGLKWFEYSMPFLERNKSKHIFAYADKATTHNHFVRVDGTLIQDSASVVVLKSDVDDDKAKSILGMLNSSTACFWLKQMSHNKGCLLYTSPSPRD